MTNDTAPESNVDTACPHSDGKSTPVCWDCAEEGHISQGTDSTTSERLGKIKKRFMLLSGGSAFGGSRHSSSQTSAPEVLPPGEGIEVGTPAPRPIEPGLEVLDGPRIVSRYLKSEDESWNTEPYQELSVGASPPMILGLRRRTFWLVLVCLVVAVVVGAAVGVAVGVTQKNNSIIAPSPVSSALSATGSEDQVSSSFLPSSSSSSSSSSSPSPTPTPSTRTETVIVVVSSTKVGDTTITTEVKSSTSTSQVDKTTKSVEVVTVTHVQTEPSSTANTLKTSASSTPSSPTANSPTSPSPTSTPLTTKSPTSPSPTTTTTTSHQTSATPTSSGPRSCLGDDGSTYTDPGTGAKFRIECSVAHQGKDIENLEAQTMQECVSMCAENSRCVGAIWYNVGPQGTDLNYCWLKKSLDDDDIRSTADAQSVVRL
ncbi:hypothetical protein F4677DRAFT_219811 [Hypoxylon crocopeplum]|nr:hypothetical protein F4677DRAFT_219811 [Hypoxylon crocopeplum]